MKKLLLLLMVGFMALAPMMASASVRTDGMGILPVQDEDIDLIWSFPQKIVDYSVVDYRMEFLSGGNDEWGGIIHKDPYLGQWGLYVDRPFQGAPPLTTPNYIAAQFGSIFDGAGTWRQRFTSSGYGTPAAFGRPWWTVLDTMPQNKLDLFKSFEAGNGILGIRLNYAAQKSNSSWNRTQSSTDDGPPATSGIDEERVDKSSVIRVVVGYGLMDLGPFKNADFSVGYGMASVEESDIDYGLNASNAKVLDESEVFEGDGINEISLNARLVKEAAENTDLITNLGVRMSKLAFVYTYTNDPDNDGVLGEAAGDLRDCSTEHKNTTINLGVNCNHKVNEGTGKVIAGLNFLYGSGEYSSVDRTNLAGSTALDQIDGGYLDDETLEISYMGVWGNIGVEANLLKWLQFRAGLSREIIGGMSITYEDQDDLHTNTYHDLDTTEQSWSGVDDTVMTFGVGVAYRNWNVDLLVAKSGIEDLLSDGDFGEGLLYSGTLLSGIVKADIRYNF